MICTNSWWKDGSRIWDQRRRYKLSSDGSWLRKRLFLRQNDELLHSFFFSPSRVKTEPSLTDPIPKPPNSNQIHLNRIGIYTRNSSSNWDLLVPSPWWLSTIMRKEPRWYSYHVWFLRILSMEKRKVYITLRDEFLLISLFCCLTEVIRETRIPSHVV